AVVDGAGVAAGRVVREPAVLHGQCSDVVNGAAAVVVARPGGGVAGEREGRQGQTARIVQASTADGAAVGDGQAVDAGRDAAVDLKRPGAVVAADRQQAGAGTADGGGAAGVRQRQLAEAQRDGAGQAGREG